MKRELEEARRQQQMVTRRIVPNSESPIPKWAVAATLCLLIAAAPAIGTPPPLRTVATEIYAAGDPLPGLPAGGLCGHAVIDETGAVFFEVLESSSGLVHLYRSNTDGSTDHLWYPGIIIDGQSECCFDHPHQWIVSADGYLFVLETDALLVAPPDGPLQVVAREDDPVPGMPGQKFSFLGSLGTLTAGPGGQAAWLTDITDIVFDPDSQRSAVCLYDHAAGTTELVLGQGDPAPEIGPGATVALQANKSPNATASGINRAGSLITLGRDNLETPSWALRVGPPEKHKAEAWEDGPVHRDIGFTYGTIYDSPCISPKLNIASQILYVAERATDIANGFIFRMGLWSGTLGNVVQRVLLDGEPAPDVNGATLWLGSVSFRPDESHTDLSDAGVFALRARLEGTGIDETNDMAIWMADVGSDLSLVMREGDPAFDSWGARFEPSTVQINQAGDLLVAGELVGIGRAVWLREGCSGAWVRLVRIGDLLVNHWVSTLDVPVMGGVSRNQDELTGETWGRSGPGLAGGLNDKGMALVQINGSTATGFDAIYRVDLTYAGDFDADRGYDLGDFAGLQRCFGGPGVTPNDTNCRVADFDNDLDVDFDDHAAFVQYLSGAVALPGGACCLRNGDCLAVSSASCCTDGLDGIYQGDNTDCEAVSCLPAVGACCLSDGNCAEAEWYDCPGAYLGDATTCATTNCAEVGACCDPVTIECTHTVAASCTGLFQGGGSRCATNACPFGQYSNEEVRNFFPPGAGVAIADDLTLEGVGARELVYLDLGVAAFTGGPFDVTVILYDDCPATGGMPIPGATFTWLAVPADGFVYVLSVDPLSPTVTVPDTVWMGVEFTTDDALWVVSGPAELGFTNNLFAKDQPPWDCSFQLCDPFCGNPYAGFWANLRCVQGGATRSAAPQESQLHMTKRSNLEIPETAAPVTARAAESATMEEAASQ